MAIIRVRNNEQRIETDLVTSILVSLQREGVPIQSVCGGRAQCGRCAIRVLRGAQFLTKKGALEAIRLEALGADPDVRLACQTHVRGDVEIEVLNLMK
jgi:adenylate cyclase